MKKKLLIIIIFILLLIIVGAIFLINGTKEKIKFNRFQKITGIFKYNGEENISDFSLDDVEQIYKIFNGKKLYHTEPSCGFSENVSIVIDDTFYFYLALDGCPNIYFKNEEKYFQLTNNEQEILFKILEKYNFRFPCV